MTSVPVRLGRDLSGRDVSFDLAAPHHGLLSGRTRSGKSIALYVLLAQMKGAPVRVCGVDPSGIVFTALGPDPWRVVTMRDVDKAKAVLAEIVAEMDRRIDSLLAAKLDKFTEFSEDMPLLLIVLEEFPAMLSVLKSHDAAHGLRLKDATETAIRHAVQRLALEGAKVGVRLWLVAQRADASLLTGVLRSQLTARISFAQDADGLRMLHESITPEQVERAQHFKPGEAYIEVAGLYPLLEYRGLLCDFPQLVATYESG